MLRLDSFTLHCNCDNTGQRACGGLQCPCPIDILFKRTVDMTPLFRVNNHTKTTATTTTTTYLTTKTYVVGTQEICLDKTFLSFNHNLCENEWAKKIECGKEEATITRMRTLKGSALKPTYPHIQLWGHNS